MVGSAEEALAQFDRRHFDVLLMDVNLPKMNGNDATRAIRQHPDPVKASVPIIAITGNTSPMDIDECRLAGMDDFVGKPVDPNALRRTVFATHNQWIEKLRQRKDVSPEEVKAPLRIMVVDDNAINQKVIGGFLQADGHDIVIVATGENAVAQAADGSFDLILMDMTLPGIDGLEATRRIRALPSREARSVTIIAITGNTGKEDVEACRQAGMDDFIGKPVNPDALYAIVNRIPRRALPPARETAPTPEVEVSLDDYLPEDKGHVQLLDEAVLNRLRKAFDRKTLSGLIDGMLAESQPLIDGMSEMARLADWREVRTKAHSLKGMTMTLGVIGVGEIAADIESSVQRGETPAILEAMLQHLQSIFDQSTQAINQWRTENMPADDLPE
jgi:CheY-like chemotaxis protein